MSHKSACSRWISLLFILFSTTLPLNAGYSFVEDRFKEKIKTPSLQEVKMVKIRLNNGIEALVISDPQTPKSGASLSVGAGMVHEPFERIGLAHFVEHMLFMGTEKYPIEKEYHEFIQENGGTSNAYTSVGQTVYMFEINNDAMSEAFSRFCSFFDSPLFNESGLSRERQAVDNEFTYRANTDALREYLVLLEMTNKDHPLNFWRCGTKETLQDVPRDELVSWYKNMYGADKMKLVVYTAQPIEEALAEIDANLSCVAQSQLPSKDIKGPLIDPKNYATKIYLETIKDLKSLSISWEVPSEFNPDLEHHTMDLVASALAEEYPGSLNSFLKKEGLIQSLSSGGDTFDGKISLFQISAELTEKGVKQVDQVISYIFQALNGLKKNGIPRYRFDELVNLSKAKYYYLSRPNVMSFVANVANNLRFESLETYPQKHVWPTKFSTDRNQAFLEALEAQNAIYVIMAPNEFMNQNLDKNEKLTRANYAQTQIPQKQIEAWNKIEPSKFIAMAPPNPYIPSNLKLIHNEIQEDSAPPKLIVKNDRSTIYFKTDSTYLVPEVYYSLYLNSPLLNSSAESQVLSDLYMLAMNDATSGLADQGSSAGLNFVLASDLNLGLNIVIQGYSEKAQMFLEETVRTVTTHLASRDEFFRYQQKLKSFYENQSSKLQPHAQAMEISRSILFKDYASYPEKLSALTQMSYSDFENFTLSLFDKIYIRAQLFGNMDQADAEKVSNFLEESFAQSTSYSLEEQKRRAVLEFDPKSEPKYITQLSDMDGNAALLIVGQGALEPKKSAALKILTKSISSPFFDTLRTKQQTGYLTHFYSQEIEKQLFSFYCVFSNSHSPRDLLARFELFNEDFLKTFNENDFNASKFEKIKGAVIEEYGQPTRNLRQKGAELSSLSFNYNGDFNLKEKNILALKDLTFEEFKEFTFNYLGRQNHGRIAALVEGNIDPSKSLDYTPIQNIDLYKAQLVYTSPSIAVSNP